MQHLSTMDKLSPMARQAGCLQMSKGSRIRHMTLTLRNIPEELNKALAERARSEGKNMDQVVLEVLQAGLGATVPRKRNLRDLAGTWVEDSQFDQIMKEQDRIDWELWK